MKRFISAAEAVKRVSNESSPVAADAFRHRSRLSTSSITREESARNLAAMSEALTVPDDIRQ